MMGLRAGALRTKCGHFASLGLERPKGSKEAKVKQGPLSLHPGLQVAAAVGVEAVWPPHTGN